MPGAVDAVEVVDAVWQAASVLAAKVGYSAGVAIRQVLKVLDRVVGNKGCAVPAQDGQVPRFCPPITGERWWPLTMTSGIPSRSTSIKGVSPWFIRFGKTMPTLTATSRAARVARASFPKPAVAPARHARVTAKRPGRMRGQITMCKSMVCEEGRVGLCC